MLNHEEIYLLSIINARNMMLDHITGEEIKLKFEVNNARVETKEITAGY